MLNFYGGTQGERWAVSAHANQVRDSKAAWDRKFTCVACKIKASVFHF